MKKILQFWKDKKINIWVIFFLLIYVVLLIKLITLREIYNNFIFGAYSILVSSYILSRFGLAYFYEHEPESFDKNYQPTISFAVPSKNEEENIRETIIKIAQTDYPKNKMDIIAINDGSSDNTLSEMLEAKKIASKIGVKVIVVDWKINKGKREGMAECIRRSKHDIIIFIDSDSFVEPDTAKELVKYFIDEKVGAVAGHAYVANANVNVLTKMQSVVYYVAFKAYKSSEALFDSVTCCSGCCSAYRRSILTKILYKWVNQKFLGVKCTYGDDRSLTNFFLKRGYKTLYAPEAKSYTFVPDTFKKYRKQQLRWKKSWIRETLKAGTFMWKRNPVASLSFYIGAVLSIMSPLILIRAFVWYPYINHLVPWFYIMGIVLISLIYGLYYYLHTKDKKWLYGTFYARLYALILVWQLPWALLTIRDGGWGTR